MIDMNSGPAEAIKGIVEGVKGKAKEAVGTFFGRGDLISEGEAQQDKAQAQRDVAKKEAAAEKARSEAKVQEARQKAAQ
ncbi:MAG: CsbD family protein [Mycobacterium sp.]